MNQRTELFRTFFQSPAPLWLGSLLFIIQGIAYFLTIPPNDYWWYVRLGQELLQTHTVPSVDAYTYTQTGKPYVYNAWLSSVLFWLLRDSTVATFLHGMLLVMFYSLIWQCCRLVGAKTRLTMLLTLMAAMAGTSQWAMRPQLFSFPLFGLTLYSLLQWQRGNDRWVWLLPIISFLWVNFHGAFPLMFLLTGAAFVGGKGKRSTLAIILIIAFLTSLINPHGIFAWLNLVTMLTDHATQLLGPEWQPPTIATSWQFKLFFLWLLIFPIITALSSKKLGVTEWLWFMGFAWMAFGGHRYMIWFVAVFAPINAILLTPLANRTIDRNEKFGKPKLNAALFTIFLLLPLAYLPGIREYWQPAPPSAYSTNTPIAATKWLKSHPELPGNLWSDLSMSVYLIYALPERPVWIDTRTNLYPLEQWQEYLTITNAGLNWESILDRYGIKLLLLDPKLQSKLIKSLTELPHWQSPYSDEHSVIFTKIQVDN